ncbi:MAG: HAD hydrolase-like protein, partial [Clostridia bacterium]|nr:HAD hydrolase-like protein [Clostridia bacterium]
MTGITHLLFDLDGTLTDSSDGILNTIAATLLRYGVAVGRDELYRFIGPPLQECFAAYLPAEQVDEAVTRYRASYNETGLFENRFYDGIPEALARLQEAGLVLGVATSKPLPPTLRILEHFGLDRYFTAVAGALPERGVHKKKDVIEL